MRPLALIVLLALAAPTLAAKPAKPPKIPKDALPCPPPDAKQIFIAPSGEPFRAEAHEGYPVVTWFAKADKDGDGRLTLAEFLADADRFFATVDSNGNGEIAPTELSRYEDETAPEISIYRQQRAMPTPRANDRKWTPPFGGVMGAGRFGLLDIPNPIASADADMNRGTTREEFRTAATRWFRQLDKPGAGYLTREALLLTPAQKQAALPCRPRIEPPAASAKAPPQKERRRD